MKEKLLQQQDNKFLLFSGIIFFLLFISLFINLGVHPLYLEEPRRAIIALEMIFNNNYIVPTEFGEFYCKKPPLYNWLIILCYKLFGNYSEFVTRIPTVLSFIGMGFSLFWIGNKYVNRIFGILAALLFLVSIDIYYYFSVLAEIDVFYSLITLLSFFSILHFYHKQQYFSLFIWTYFLGALGVLTKGFPSFVFLGISLPVFFLYNKDFKKLFSTYHLCGLIVFGVTIGGYFFIYSKYNSLDCYLQDLWSQSSERTVIGKSVRSLFSHLFLFPLEIIKNVLPASLFLIFAFRKDFLSKIKENKLIEFCFYIFISNSIAYWISPGTRARYVYMLYPLVILILLYFFLVNEKDQRQKYFDAVIAIVLVLMFVASICLPFIPQFEAIPGVVAVSVLSAIFVAGAIFLFYKNVSYRLLILCFGLVMMWFVYDFTVLPSRALPHQQAQIEKMDAKKMAEIIQTSQVHMLSGIRLSHSSVFYIERAVEKVLDYQSEKNTSDFFIVVESQVQSENYKVFYEFNSADEKKLLIKFL